MKAKRSLLAVVLTALLFPVGCGHIDKQETDAILVGVSGAALEASLIPVIGTPVATDGAVVQVGGLLISYVVDSLAEAPNNPDQVFDSVATVTAVRFTPVPITTGSPKLFFDINESLVLIGRLVDDGRLIDLSLRKFYGARNAGNVAKASLQRNAVCEAVVRFDANLRGLHDALINISTGIQGTAVASISITVAEALALREQIIRDGSFPPSEMFVFSEAGVTPPEKAGAVREVELTTLSGLTNADLRGAVIFEKLASTIDRVSIQGFLPQDFTCNVIPPVGAPALSQWGAIIMSLLLLTAGIAFIVRRWPVMAVASTAGVAQFNDEMHRPLFVPELFGKALVGVFGAVLIGFAGVTWLSGPIKLLDIGGTLLCAVLFAYLVHLLILAANGSKAIR